MNNTTNKNLIALLEIGSSKTIVMICQINSNQTLQFLSHAEEFNGNFSTIENSLIDIKTHQER